MNSFKSIVLWIIIFIVCIVLAMKMMERTIPIELTTSEFLSIAAENAPPPAEGEANRAINPAFDGEVVDKGGKIEGKLSTALLADANLPAVVRTKIKKGNYPEDKPVPFTSEYHDLQSEYIIGQLQNYGVAYNASRQSTLFLSLILPILLPVLLILAIWMLFMRQVQSSGNKAMSFGKSKAKLIAEGQVKVSFDDVAGVEEAKGELCEVVDFLKDPKKYSRLGGKIPKGVLLYGPPGTGKTMLAKAVAGEASVPFFSISGSDFVEMFVGVGASRVRDLFEQAKKSKPCLIFIDEIDAVGRHRFAGIGGGHDEREQTLNQLLVEMDGFATNEGVILIAATNRPDVLDPALLRPGRFDRQIAVDFPDVEGRLKILKVHAKNVKLDSAVDLVSVAKGTPGFSGADLANIINESALLAARESKTAVGQVELEEAKDRVMMGPERRSMKISDAEKRATAIHEAGHAIAARFTPGTDPVHKITIIPRGRSLGQTAFLPLEEKHSRMKSELKAALVGLLGGLAAERIALGETGTGVGNDLQRVTSMARRMVCEFGMSERLGPRTFGDTRSTVFVGRDMGGGNDNVRDYGEDVAQIIDEEVQGLVQWALDQALGILTEHRDLLDRLTNALVERETIDAEEFEMIIAGKELPVLFKPGEGKPPNPDSGPGKEDARDRKPKTPPRLSDFLDSPSGAPG